MSANRPKPDAWMPLFVGDYLGDTARLTTEQHGAYLLLIMDYWRNGPPPNDDAVLAQIARLDKRTWQKHRQVIQPLFRVSGGQWRHKRVDQEIAGATERSGKAAMRAKAAAEARWSKDRTGQDGDTQSNASGMLQALPDASDKQCLGNALHLSPVTLPEANASGPVPIDPNAFAWSQGVAILTGQGGMTEAKAKSFIGGLLKANALEARDLLGLFGSAIAKGTTDPKPYLTQGAKGIASRRNPLPEKRVEWC